MIKQPKDQDKKQRENRKETDSRKKIASTIKLDPRVEA